MTEPTPAPEIRYYIALDAVKRGGEKPLLALRAVWEEERRSAFLIQSRPEMPDTWRSMFRLWVDIEEGCSPLSVEEIDHATFAMLLDRQGIAEPTLDDWRAVRQHPSGHHVPIVRRNPVRPDLGGPALA